MPAKKAKKTAHIPDIRSEKDMAALKDMLKSHPITLVLIYADWCGHCHTYKAQEWKELSAVPNRTVGMAQLNSDVLDKSPLANAKISGYPSVLMVGNDGKPAEFVENGEPTNAMPNARDTESMKTILTAPPESLNAAVNEAVSANGASLTSLDLPPTGEDPTKKLTPAAENLAKNSAEMLVNNSSGLSAAGSANESADAADVEEEILQSQAAAAEATGASAEMVGGSLYRALLEAGQAVAPAAALSVGAIWASRRSRRNKSLKKARRVRSRTAKLRARLLKSLKARRR